MECEQSRPGCGGTIVLAGWCVTKNAEWVLGAALAPIKFVHSPSLLLGCCNSPTFSRLMSLIAQGLPCCLAFIDDMVV